MKRRSFIKSSSAIGVPLLINGIPVNAISRSSFLNLVSPENDKILVLIQLTGGNDGLNTVLPLDQYSALDKARNKILIKENLALKLRDNLGLHPVMTGMKALYDEGKISLIQSVGYPNQNRSHFRSTDIWTSGSAVDVFETTGWLGRYYYPNHTNYPNGYPNNDNPDPLAITIGSLVSQTCQGPITNFSLAVNDPENLIKIPQGELATSVPNTNYGIELKYLQTMLLQNNDYSDIMTNAYTAAGGTITSSGNPLQDKLNIVSQLIKGGLRTKVYVVDIGTFDTHANQCDPTDHEIGNHATLLQRVSDAVKAFQTELEKSGNDKRVIGMTFSEFGRRILANDSTGTDHGTAAPMFMFGTCIKGGILGNNPTINDTVANDEGVAMQYDFRSVYASVLMDWFGLSAAEVKSTLFSDFQKLPVIEGCAPTNTDDYSRDFGLALDVISNPVMHTLKINYHTGDEKIRLSVFDSMGSEIKILVNGRSRAGEHNLSWEMGGVPSGNYFVRIASLYAQKTEHFSKID